MKRQVGNIGAAFLAVVFATGVATSAQQAPTFTVLYPFKGAPDGAFPYAGLIMDNAGNLYGATAGGGAGTCSNAYTSSGCGTLFKLDASGNETVLYSFRGSDGASPFFAGLIRDTAGNLYGTTLLGGAGSCTAFGPGCGTVFKLDVSGNETVLHSFSGADGANPRPGLIIDNAGNLYGTTEFGGAYDAGAVFKLDSSGNETVLHSFTFTGGDVLYAGLIMDTAGNLYGTTGFGGNFNAGTVFKLDASGNETVLHTFAGAPSDGVTPFAGLIMDTAGNLYGTTTTGGAGTCSTAFGGGCGTVFKLDASGNETVLHSFTGADGFSRGAGLIMDKVGNLYGATVDGGASGVGAVFKLDTFGNETVLHSFTGGDGMFPYAGLIMDATGNLYGTTSGGGAHGYGTVFKLTVQKPTITSISPTNAIAGGPGFTLTVNGTNFVNGSTVSFNANARPATFVSGTQLTAVIQPSEIGAASTFNVTVSNPSGGGTSNAVSFTVVTPQQASQNITDAVNLLFSQGVLNGGQNNSLVVQLQHAISLMNAGKDNGAIGNLESFISEVNDLLSSGVLSPSQAASLISTAQSVIAALS